MYYIYFISNNHRPHILIYCCKYFQCKYWIDFFTRVKKQLDIIFLIGLNLTTPPFKPSEPI